VPVFHVTHEKTHEYTVLADSVETAQEAAESEDYRYWGEEWVTTVMPTGLGDERAEYGILDGRLCNMDEMPVPDEADLTEVERWRRDYAVGDPRQIPLRETPANGSGDAP